MADNRVRILLTAKDQTGKALTSVQGRFVDLSQSVKTAEKRTEQFGKKSAAALKKADTGVERLTASATSLNTTLSGLGLGLGVASLTAFASKAVDVYTVQEQAELQLEQRLRSTGNAAGWTSEQLQRHASALQGVTTFGDEATMQMQALLLTFTQIRGPVFRDAVEIIQDMSVAMDQDLKSSAIQVGKALNDPILGVSALSRVGVQFTEQQKEQIKTLVKSGDTMEAQKIILRELQTEFGGAARAAREGLGGALTALSNKMGDVLEVSVDLVGGYDNGAGAVNNLTGALEGLEYILMDVNKLLDETGKKTEDAWYQKPIPWLSKTSANGEQVGLSLKDSMTLLPGMITGQSQIKLLNFYRDLRAAEDEAAQAQENLRSVADSFVSDIWATPDGVTTTETSDALKEVTDALAYEQEQLGRATTLQRAYNECKKAGVDIDSDEGQKILAKVAALDQEIAAQKKRLAADAAEKARQARITASIASLQEEADTYGKSATQIGLYRLEQLQATSAQLEQAKAIYATIEALKAQEAEQARTGPPKATIKPEMPGLSSLPQQPDVSMNIDMPDWQFGAITALHEYETAAMDTFSNVQRVVGNSFTSLEDTLVQFATTGELAFGEMVTSIMADIMRLVVKQTIIGPLAMALSNTLAGAFNIEATSAATAMGNTAALTGLLTAQTTVVGGLTTAYLALAAAKTAAGAMGGAAGASGGGSGTVASAHGNVFTGPGIAAYENRIVSRPTVFPFAHGTGLMGEAGPEGILPLARTASGDLGVKTTGQSQQSAPSMTVNIHEAPGTTARVEQSADGQSLNVIIEQVEKAMSGRMSRGAGMASYLDSRYRRRY